MIRRTIALAGAALLALAVTSCSGSSPGARSAVEADQLIGIWTVDASFDSPEQPFVSFAEDGSWMASDGCNRVQGTWELGELGALTTTAGPSTLMWCDGAQLPLAVEQADYVEVLDADTIVIHSTQESTSTTLVRTDDPAIGPLDQPIGHWVDENDPDDVFLTLAADGSFAGNDGCNVLSGSWTVADDDSIVFGEVVSTLRLCESVDTWLSSLAVARVLSGVMTVQDVEGAVIGQLTIQ